MLIWVSEYVPNKLKFWFRFLGVLNFYFVSPFDSPEATFRVLAINLQFSFILSYHHSHIISTAAYVEVT